MTNIFQKLFGGGGQAEIVKDPVCGMVVDPQTAKAKIELGGQTFYFCSENCKQAFLKKLTGEKAAQKNEGHCQARTPGRCTWSCH